MKKVLLILLLPIMIIGCKKDDVADSHPKVVLHYTVTASDAGDKFVDSDIARFNFTGKTYEGNYNAQSGLTVRLSCGYSADVPPASTIRIVVTKDGATISDQTKTQRVDLNFVAP